MKWNHALRVVMGIGILVFAGLIVNGCADQAPAIQQAAQDAPMVLAAATPVIVAANNGKTPSGLSTASQVVGQVAPVVATAAGNVQTATTPAAKTDAAVQGAIGVVAAAAPFIPPPYGTYVALGATLASLIFGLIKSRQATTATTALVQTGNGIQSALANGQMTATPEAAAVIDSHLTVIHPASDGVVDVVAAGATTATK